MRRGINWMHMLPAMAMAGAIILTACGGKKEHNPREESRDLFEKSTALTMRYLDSLGAARDSARVNALAARYQDEMTKLNYEYSPDADPGLSDSENDTLTMLTMKMVNLRDSLLWRFAHPQALPDSLSQPADSVSDPGRNGAASRRAAAASAAAKGTAATGG